MNLQLPRDCFEVKALNWQSKSGVYVIENPAEFSAMPVYCDFDTMGGGWMVFQRRGTYILSYVIQITNGKAN